MSELTPGGGAGAMPSTPSVPTPTVAAAPPAGDLTLYVQKIGDPMWAEVSVASTVSVARLLKEVAKELPSLKGKDMSTVSLHVADKGADGTYKPRETALPSREKLVDAGLTDGMSIVVKSAAATAAPKKQSQYVLNVTHSIQQGRAALHVEPGTRLESVKDKIAEKFKAAVRNGAAFFNLHVATDTEGKVLSAPLDEAATVEEALNHVKLPDGTDWTRPPGCKWKLVIMDVKPKDPEQFIELYQWVVSGDEPDIEEGSFCTFKVPSEDRFNSLIAGGGFVGQFDVGSTKIKARISSWTEALERFEDAGTFLQYFTSTWNYDRDVKGIQNFCDHVAKALERQTTCAIAQDPGMQKEFGGLKLLNEGRSIKIKTKDFVTSVVGGVQVTKEVWRVFMELDGVIANSVALLLNECKTAIKPNDIKVMKKRCATLLSVLQNPAGYKCDGCPELLTSYGHVTAVIPVASSALFSRAAEDVCVAKGISSVKPTAPAGVMCCTPRLLVAPGASPRATTAAA